MALLEYPQYTRPAEFRGWDVPEVLRSGDHGGSRAGAGRRRCAAPERRPDLLIEPPAPTGAPRWTSSRPIGGRPASIGRSRLDPGAPRHEPH